MWSTLQDQQSQIQLLINEQERLLRKQDSLTTDLETQAHKRNELKKLLTQEQLDVEKLDEFSFAKMMRNWKGTQEEVRDLEESQAAAVELKWNEAVKMVRDLEIELDHIRKELSDVRFYNLNTKWQHLMKQKEQWLHDNSPQNLAVLNQIYTRKTTILTMLKEIKEAQAAGSAAKTLLSRAINELASAKSFSTWDTFLGGGLIVTAMKHNAIDDSEDTIHNAQIALHRFQTEMKDVQALEANSFVVERGNFVTMADYFFDDIFSEWTIHSRIKKSQDNLQNTVNEVEKIVRVLTEKKSVLQSELSELETNRKQLIEA